jgi:hypothetical protein
LPGLFLHLSYGGQVSGLGHGLGAVFGLQFAQDVVDVAFYCAQFDHDVMSDLAVG